MRSRVAGMADTLWAARDGGELMDVVAEVEALKSTLDAIELEVVRELEATGAVKSAGWASTQDFVTHVAGGHKGTGPATVRLATATAEPDLGPVAEEALRRRMALPPPRPTSSNAPSTRLPSNTDTPSPRSPGAARRRQAPRRLRTAQGRDAPRQRRRPRR